MATTAIVIPLLRQVDEWLEQCVESALAQTVACDVVVVTSPHTPASNRALLERLQARAPSLRVIGREPEMKFAAALNFGIRSTASERIGFLLSDDWLAPNAVERALSRDADIVSTQMRAFAGDGATLLEPLGQHRKQSLYEALALNHERASYLGHFFLFQKEALDRVGGVDETVGDSPGVDDFDLIWCLLDQGASVAIVEEPLYSYRDHSGERLTTRRREDMLATFEKILDKHGVKGRQRARMIRDHSPWFGRPIYSVFGELQGKLAAAQPRPKALPSALKPVQFLYRAMLPLQVRIMIQDHFLWWWH